jgi:hypothetical protein
VYALSSHRPTPPPANSTVPSPGRTQAAGPASRNGALGLLSSGLVIDSRVRRVEIEDGGEETGEEKIEGGLVKPPEKNLVPPLFLVRPEDGVVSLLHLFPYAFAALFEEDSEDVVGVASGTSRETCSPS